MVKNFLTGQDFKMAQELDDNCYNWYKFQPISEENVAVAPLKFVSQFCLEIFPGEDTDFTFRKRLLLINKNYKSLMPFHKLSLTEKT